MGNTSKPDDFAQGRILALRTALGAMVLSHPNLADAANKVAEALAKAEGEWIGQKVPDMFIEGLQEETVDLQALINTSLSLRAPTSHTSIPRNPTRSGEGPEGN